MLIMVLSNEESLISAILRSNPLPRPILSVKLEPSMVIVLSLYIAPPNPPRLLTLPLKFSELEALARLLVKTQFSMWAFEHDMAPPIAAVLSSKVHPDIRQSSLDSAAHIAPPFA